MHIQTYILIYISICVINMYKLEQTEILVFKDLYIIAIVILLSEKFNE